MTTRRIEPKPGQESVWDYPRPPRLENCFQRIRVLLGDVVLADSEHAKRVLETSHPPVYYIPAVDVRMDCLRATDRQSWCEWKGQACYYDVVVEDREIVNAAWSYLLPVPAFAAIRGHLAFYAHLVDACFVGDERVEPQAGSFYGGWITRNVVGPFKGKPGTEGW